MTKQYTCLLDLDGVLVEFVRGALAFHNKQLPPKEVRWHFPEQIGFKGILANEFWDPLGQEFWANLDWTEEGEHLLSELESLFGNNIAIVSSPCNTPGCDDGKRDWVRKHLPEYRRRTFLGGDKHVFADSSKVLIDDYDPHISNFLNAGGQAFLVPRPWNSAISLTDDNGSFCVDTFISQVKTALEL